MATKLHKKYAVGVRVWMPNEEEVYTVGTVSSQGEEKIHVVEESGKDTKFKLNDKHKDELPPLKNTIEAPDELTRLPFLHEPAVLHNLRARYEKDIIYTYTGPVLVAVNPFKALPLYEETTLFEYSKFNDSMGPHIYAVAAQAHRSMMMEKKDQSIIMSGESGAGKSVTCRHVLRYFAFVSQQSGGGKDNTLERKLLASDPLMEAFGNAKTTRNDNSSRFGKFILIQFNNQNQLVGAKVTIYLLEKSRVVWQQANERNYHIFYQLVKGVKDEWRSVLKLDKDPNSYKYINQGNCPDVNNVDDSKDFEETSNSLSMMGVSEEVQFQLWKAVAAILHLGNIEITPKDDESEIDPNSEALINAADLLGVPKEDLSKWICYRRMSVARGTTYEVPVKKEQAITSRDSLAKLLYATIFDWVVATINKTITVQDTSAELHSIGVLDIYGFESFKHNSFEQLCINYANESLQQLFAKFVFKEIQDEYVREGIDWEPVDYPDNQACLELIEKKPTGILSMLDEECRTPRGSDLNFCEKLTNTHKKKHPNFEAPKVGREKFTVKHFAGDVTYTSDGFMDKNKDFVVHEHLLMLSQSNVPFMKDLMEFYNEAQAGVASSGSKFISVATQFKASLVKLVATINATEPHFVRCIKPNMEKQPMTFDPKVSVNQLRAVGLVATVKIMNAAQYPLRIPYAEFWKNFYYLGSGKGGAEPGSMEAVQNLMYRCRTLTPGKDYQLGKTKLFSTLACMDELQSLLRVKLREYAVTIQCAWRVYKAKVFVALLRRQHAAARKIQARVRGWHAREWYQQTYRAIVQLQAVTRGFKARLLFKKMWEEKLEREAEERRLEKERLEKEAEEQRAKAEAAAAAEAEARARADEAEAERLRKEKEEAERVMAENKNAQDNIQKQEEQAAEAKDKQKDLKKNAMAELLRFIKPAAEGDTDDASDRLARLKVTEGSAKYRSVRKQPPVSTFKQPPPTQSKAELQKIIEDREEERKEKRQRAKTKALEAGEKPPEIDWRDDPIIRWTEEGFIQRFAKNNAANRPKPAAAKKPEPKPEPAAVTYKDFAKALKKACGVDTSKHDDLMAELDKITVDSGSPANRKELCKAVVKEKGCLPKVCEWVCIQHKEISTFAAHLLGDVLSTDEYHNKKKDKKIAAATGEAVQFLMSQITLEGQNLITLFQCCRAVAGFCTSAEAITRLANIPGALKAIGNMLNSEYKECQLQACRVIARVAQHTEHRLKAYGCGGLPLLLRLAARTDEWAIRLASVVGLANMTETARGHKGGVGDKFVELDGLITLTKVAESSPDDNSILAAVGRCVYNLLKFIRHHEVACAVPGLTKVISKMTGKPHPEVKFYATACLAKLVSTPSYRNQFMHAGALPELVGNILGDTALRARVFACQGTIFLIETQGYPDRLTRDQHEALELITQALTYKEANVRDYAIDCYVSLVWDEMLQPKLIKDGILDNIMLMLKGLDKKLATSSKERDDFLLETVRMLFMLASDGRFADQLHAANVTKDLKPLLKHKNQAIKDMANAVQKHLE